MLEDYLIFYASPTLACLKTASLFNVKRIPLNKLEAQIDILNKQFKTKGLYLTILKKSNNNALVYLYRKTLLNQDLLRPGVNEFLKAYGYEYNNADRAIESLKQRFNHDEAFPHEIGIFLGYPLEDVIGYIQNSGKNSKCCGFWKVYGDDKSAEKKFLKLDKCRSIYNRLWKKGCSIHKLTVAA